MSVNAKRFWISLSIVLVMFFWIEPKIVWAIWGLFPASAADWGKVIRFVFYFPVTVIVFWLTFAIIGIFLTASKDKENKAKMDAFKKKHDFPKGW